MTARISIAKCSLIVSLTLFALACKFAFPWSRSALFELSEGSLLIAITLMTIATLLQNLYAKQQPSWTECAVLLNLVSLLILFSAPAVNGV